MLSFAVTDLSNNFDFDFTTLNRKALYESYLFNFPVFIFPKVFFFLASIWSMDLFLSR